MWGHFNIYGFLSRDFGIDLPPLLVIHDRQSLDLKHNNIYAYSYLNFLKNVTFTLGLSGDFTRGESPDTKSISQANPKFGITWNPVPNTTLRAAAFRVLKRTLVTNATLETTQVAGFNQFYDDFNGTEAWRYGAAVDQKFTKEIFGGVEFSKRDLKTPAIGPANTTIKENMEEYLNRIYLFWTPHPWLALRTQYMFEQYRTEGLTGEPKKLNTHGVPLGVNFFHPSGASAFLTGTYYHQDIKLADSRSGRNDFWLLDLGINYRLPKRYGFLTVGATNLFDKKFKYFERDQNNSRIQPNRTIFGKITLALP